MRQLRSTIVLLGLFFASGCAGLIYELVWTRRLVLLSGGTTHAITITVAAFMAGLGLGAYLAGRWADRLTRPGRAFGVLEVAVGLSALAVPGLLQLAEPMYGLLYRASAGGWGWLTLVRFAISFLVLMVPTTLMGATLPILVRHATGLGRHPGRSVALLYGVNTLGAVAGALAAGFLLLPRLGVNRTTWTAVAVNLLVGTAALVLLRQRVERVATAPQRKPSARPAPSGASSGWPDKFRLAVLATAMLSGLAAMVCQIAWTRALIMSIGSSTYAFTCILAAFILGLGGGSMAIARWADRIRHPLRLLGSLQLGIGLAAVLLIPAFGQLPRAVQWFVSRGGASVFGGSLALVIAVTLVPTLLMGATFPLVVRLLARSAHGAAQATGQAYALNTLGAIAGSLLAGFVLIRSDTLGVRGSILAAALLSAAVGWWLLMLARPAETPLAPRAWIAVVVVGVFLLIGLGLGRWDPAVMSGAAYLGDARRDYPGRRVIYYGEGPDATVSLEGNPDRNYLAMAINGKVDASTERHDMITQSLLGHLPAMFVRDGRRACVIGLGSGVTLHAVAQYPSYRRIDCIEISREVIKAAEHFAPFNGRVLDADPRVRIIRADGRNHLLLTEYRYDLIISEPSNPWIAGQANLFTREFFRLCRRRLSDGGTACFWVQGYAISLGDFQMVARTLCEVFESVSLWETAQGEYLFLARRRSGPVPLEDLLRRFDVPQVRADLYRVGFGRPGRLLGAFVTSHEALRSWAAQAPIHTDDNALLEFSAPWSLYRRSGCSMPDEDMIGLQRSPFDSVLAAAPHDATHQRIVKQVGRSMRARQLRVEAFGHLSRGIRARAVAGMLEAYRVDPGNVLVFGCLCDLRQSLPKGRVPTAEDALLSRLGTLRPPTLAPGAPRSGDTLADVAKMLAGRASWAIRQQRWDLAADFCDEAHSIDPNAGRAIWKMLIDRLGTALQSGEISVESLRSDPALEQLRGRAEFDALLRRH